MPAPSPLPVAKPKPAIERPRPTSAGVYLVAWLAALVLHAGGLFGWQRARSIEQVEFAVESGETSVEVSLVAALPAEQPPEAVETPPEPEPPPVVEPPPPEPMPEPVPIPEKPPEMTLPEPEPAPEPRPVAPPKPKPEKALPKPKPVPRTARPVGDGSSPIPGNDAITAQRSAGAASAKPGYLRNPHPAYPEAARAAGQQGVVMLRVSVDAQGNPTSVRLTRSSGFAVLDERARSTVASQWKFKPARIDGQPVASTVVIPIRFTLNGR